MPGENGQTSGCIREWRLCREKRHTQDRFLHHNTVPARNTLHIQQLLYPKMLRQAEYWGLTQPAKQCASQMCVILSPHTAPFWHPSISLPTVTIFTTFNSHIQNLFITKPTRHTNFTNLLRHETLHVSGSSYAHHQEFIHCTLGTGICYTGL